MSAPNFTNPETIALHAGWRADPTTGSVAVPIHQTTSFQFQDTGHAARLFALAESYPDLKADAALRDLSDELAHTENRVGFSRQAYNDAVLAFNTSVQSFPGNLGANLFGFQILAMLQSTSSDEERASVRVNLDAR